MSSPKIYRPPLARQLLPWLFVLVFLVTAPLLIFYTSGYRYNFKKGLVERNGTLIIDSTPDDAAVFIDGRPTGERTPITLQNMVPGWHTVRVERPNYSSWQENVLIRSERVTFANHLWLWRLGEPHLVQPGTFTSIHADPLRERALLSESREGEISWRLWTQEAPLERTPLPQATTNTRLQTQWRRDGQAALLKDARNGQTWWVHSVKGRETVEPLPPGTYHWAGTNLIGNTEKTTLHLDADALRFVSSSHASHVFEESQGLALQSSASSSEERILVDDSFVTRRFALPAGRWSFGEIRRPFVLLQDQDRWLILQMKFGQPYAETIRGDYPRWTPREEPLRAVFLQENELWLWTSGTSPALLWRQSTPLIQTAWHRSGDYLFLADRTQLFALSLHDGSDQRVTPLAHFEEIQDFTVLDRTISIAGTREGRSGIWELTVE